ncbi:growth-regulating factor 7 isoform X2 [Quercus lobata]|uniref:growth-regulating factor 7 isoform X2 n=1 Tax=Quercus lobata TaxID=97700 RepID=UPI001243C493|nr:growth-regulating factor 7 isoform X2 [Quercus lobata]
MIRMDSLDFVNKEAKRESSSVKLQSSNIEESFTNKVIMFHHGNHHRPFSSSSSPSYEVKVGDGGDGPTCKNRSIISNDTYDVVVGGSGSAVAVTQQQHTRGGAGVRTVQPFDTATTPHTASKSPVRMAASLGFPFTIAQWRELERQAMIYKYMMASAPIPPELLIPTCRNTSDPAASHSHLGGSGFNLRLSNSTDPEPGRCKRTDGKKWRCSRDVAPDHKYCERHLHRGRPRSRKPVEIHTKTENIINNNNNSSSNNNIIKRTRREDYHVLPTTSSPVTVAYPNPTINTNGFPSQFLGPAQPYHQPTVASHKEPWCLDWMVKGAHVPTATYDQQWYPMMETKMGFTSGNSFSNTNAPVFKQRYAEGPLNLNLYECFRNYEDSRNKDCALSFNSDMVSTQKPDTGATRGFIDAWSNSITQENIANSSAMCSVSPNGRLSPSSLTLSVGGGNSIGEEMGKFPMGLGLFGRDQSNDNGTKSHLTNWLTPASSVASTPGGPLAEVLRPSIAGAASNSSSPIAGNGDLGSSPVTMVSSPSGVLQRTLPSLSDSSGNSSSSTIVSSAVNPEMALLWLN